MLRDALLFDEPRRFAAHFFGNLGRFGSLLNTETLAKCIHCENVRMGIF
jgi:hypothetical protein